MIWSSVTENGHDWSRSKVFLFALRLESCISGRKVMKTLSYSIPTLFQKYFFREKFLENSENYIIITEWNILREYNVEHGNRDLESRNHIPVNLTFVFKMQCGSRELKTPLIWIFTVWIQIILGFGSRGPHCILKMDVRFMPLKSLKKTKSLILGLI